MSNQPLEPATVAKSSVKIIAAKKSKYGLSEIAIGDKKHVGRFSHILARQISNACRTWIANKKQNNKKFNACFEILNEDGKLYIYRAA